MDANKLKNNLDKMIEHLTKVKNILMIPNAYLRDKKHNTKVVRDIVLFLMIGMS